MLSLDSSAGDKSKKRETNPLLAAWCAAGGDTASYRGVKPDELNDYELAKLRFSLRIDVEADTTTKRFLTKTKGLLGEPRFSQVVAEEAERRNGGHFNPEKPTEAFVGLLLKVVGESKGRVEAVKRALAEREAGKSAADMAPATPDSMSVVKKIFDEPMPLAADTQAKKNRVVKRRILRAQLVEEIGGESDFLWACPAFVQVTLPHQDPKTVNYSRSNGQRFLDMTSGFAQEKPYGLPYGVRPRLLLHYIAGKVRATGSREIALPDTIYALSKELGLDTSGQANFRATAQMALRLFHCRFAFGRIKDGNKHYHVHTKYVQFADEVMFGWDDDGRQHSLFDSRIKLHETMHQIMRDGVFPIRKVAIRAIQQSSMALDLYTWLGWRNFVLLSKNEVSVAIPITSSANSVGLMEQIGAGYSEPKYFVRSMLRALELVRSVWIGTFDVRYDADRKRLIIGPSTPQTDSTRTTISMSP